MRAKTCLLIFTDGRGEYLVRTLRAFKQYVDWEFDATILVDDSNDPSYRGFLEGICGEFRMEIQSNPTRLGIAGTVARAWGELLPADAAYIFHLEDDFTVQRKLKIEEMIEVLEKNKYLTQIALMRQPWNEAEKAAGSIWNLLPDAWTQQAGWVEHRVFGWTGNPSLYPHWITQAGWRVERECEGRFSGRLLLNTSLRSAFWGKVGDPPWVEHIGVIRKGPWVT
ncbi:MAG: hypothetical protein V1800_17260 [Candidatus Latescibacterota bacterium]